MSCRAIRPHPQPKSRTARRLPGGKSGTPARRLNCRTRPSLSARRACASRWVAPAGRTVGSSTEGRQSVSRKTRALAGRDQASGRRDCRNRSYSSASRCADHTRLTRGARPATRTAALSRSPLSRRGGQIPAGIVEPPREDVLADARSPRAHSVVVWPEADRSVLVFLEELGYRRTGADGRVLLYSR